MRKPATRDTRHLADSHLDEPAVDDEIRRDVPKILIASARALAAWERDVQELVCDHETPLWFRKTRCSVRVEFPEPRIDVFAVNEHRASRTNRAATPAGRRERQRRARRARRRGGARAR